MRTLVVVVCCLVLASVAVQAGSLSAEELLELENILKEYETVQQMLDEGLLQLTEGQLLLARGEMHLSQQIIDLETSLVAIEKAGRDQQARMRKGIVIIVSTWLAVEAVKILSGMIAAR